MKWFALVVGVTVAGFAATRGPAGADDRGGLPPDLAYVPGKAAVLVTLRPAHQWEHEFAKGLRGKLGKEADEFAASIKKTLSLPVTEVERVTMVMTHIAPGSGANPLVFVAAARPVDRAKLLAALVPKGEEKTQAGQKYFASETNAVVIFDDRHFAQGTPGDVQSMLDAGKTKADAALTPGLKLAAGKSAVVVAVNPEEFAQFGDELGAEGEPFKPLLKAKLGVVTLDSGPTLKAALRVEFASVDAAKGGAKAVEAARDLTIEALGQAAKQFAKAEEAAGVRLLGLLSKELQSAKVARDGAAVTAAVEMKLDRKTLGPLLGDVAASIRRTAARTTDANNLKHIAIAMHNYADTHGSFPPQAVYDKDGKALLSWRVLLLPFLEQDDLYQKFKLNEPWDSPHNKKLLARMPDVYKHPTAKARTDHGTFYQVFHGNGAAFEGQAGQKVPAAFPDGMSNTLLAACAPTDMPWSKPGDIAFDPAKELPKLGEWFKGGHSVLFADGSARFLSPKIKPETMKALITRAGGEVINDENY